MSRRSARLLMSGYYRTDTDDEDEIRMSYRESPVRKKSGSRRTKRSSIQAPSTAHTNDKPVISKHYKGLAPGLRRGSASPFQAPGVAPPLSRSYTLPTPQTSAGPSSTTQTSAAPSSTTQSTNGVFAQPSCPVKDPCVSSGYYSSEGDELLNRRRQINSRTHCRKSSGVTPSCCWVFCLLMDLLLLSDRTQRLRKVVLTVTALTSLLALVLWFCFPALTVLFTQNDSNSRLTAPQASVAEINTSLDDIFSRLDKTEQKWRKEWIRKRENLEREISVQKQRRQKEVRTSEMLVNELRDLKLIVKNGKLDHGIQVRQELASVQKKISALRMDVSSLHAATSRLKQQLEYNKHTLDIATLKDELTDWLGRFWPPPSQDPVVLPPDLQEVLQALEQRLLEQLKEEKRKESEELWVNVRQTLQREGLGSVTAQDVEDIVQRALSLYRADGIGMADFALESSGASIITSHCSETFFAGAAVVSLFGHPLWYLSRGPQTIIQPDVYPGRCWAFQGDQGFVTIALSHPVYVTHVTLEHIPKALSPVGHIRSAPRDFTVYGMTPDLQDEGKLLGKLIFDLNGESIQTFELPDSVRGVYSVVQLSVLSNWGNPDYTCVYRFRVHGKPLA